MTNSQILDAINQNIKRNENKEITGEVLNSVLRLLLDFVNQGFITINDIVKILADSKSVNIVGSIAIDTDTTLLPSGIYNTQTSGIYTNAGNIVVKEGYYTLLRKNADGNWSLESETKMPMQDLTPLNDRVTQVENDVNNFIENFSVTTDLEFNAESNNPIANSAVTPLAQFIGDFVNQGVLLHETKTAEWTKGAFEYPNLTVFRDGTEPDLKRIKIDVTVADYIDITYVSGNAQNKSLLKTLIGQKADNSLVVLEEMNKAGNQIINATYNVSDYKFIYANVIYSTGYDSIIKVYKGKISTQLKDVFYPIKKVLKSFINNERIKEWKAVDDFKNLTAGSLYDKDLNIVTAGGYSRASLWSVKNKGAKYIRMTGNFNVGGSGIMFLGKYNSVNDFVPVFVGATTLNELTYEIDDNFESVFLSIPDGVIIEYGYTEIDNSLIKEDAVMVAIREQVGNVLNFKDFGAKCDGVTNDTIAFNNAINYLLSQGGGRIRLSGVMKINQSAIPINAVSNYCTIEIIGDFIPPGIYGSIGSMPVSWKGSVILCEDTNYDASKGVIYTIKNGPGSWEYNSVMIVLENLVVRTTDGAPINALNLENFQQAIVKNVNIDTGVYAGQAIEPMKLTYGLKMPKRNNAALSIVDNVYSSGYNKAFSLNEHTNADNLQVNCCKVAFELIGAGHPILVKRALAQKCTKVVEVVADNMGNITVFEIQQLVVEKASSETITPGHEWQLPSGADIQDNSNVGRGYITYNATIGGVSLNEKLTRSGGDLVKIRKIGDVNWS